MSADNWAVCPRCVKQHEAEVGRREAEVAAAYGSVSVEEFDEMRKSATEFAMSEQRYTFREDYEFYGAEEGEVHAVYSGGCTECGLGLKFHDVHPMAVTP